MQTLPLYLAAALAEISGCFAFWAWLRLDRSILWLVPGLAALAAFAWILTLTPLDHAGRAYALYGGIYIATSLLWLRLVEGQMPDRWDLLGAGLCLLGAMIILFGPRDAPLS
ncbi:YnfA family protein [Pseudohoeflea coraliihabitans]|uniref:YnfA family protein n=1 Tax=Pseudohoeflea coraliihabitans TaxID=2860393 RepID=A0ABS6WJ59_9HYPH|nr:YnfA family protein [Pseudohoeflea sp. DP4N28-3]MBW3095875.1 YnfA family protein [Pseudohoeflea sp. DP4N28-3]